DYPIFTVIDADCILPQNFICSLLPLLLSDSKLAFVQVPCLPRTDQQHLLAKVMSPMLIPMWELYMRYRNRWGFVPFLGRGALLNREAWEATGGFPEIVAEDIGFALA